MEDRAFNRLVDGIVNNEKRVKKIRQCGNLIEKNNLAIRYAVACAKDEKVKVTEGDIWHVACAAVRVIDPSVN